MQVIYHILILSENLLGETETQVGTVAALLILRFHFHHDAGGVIGEVNRILLVERHADDVTFPADPLILVYSIKLSNGAVRIINERVVPAVFSVVAPLQP